MHYFIDGYNLLFRLLHGDADLQSQREIIILDLNQKISLLNLDVSIVFDAAFQIGERTRHHYDQLEILFTAEGETADEYILDEIKNHPHPQQETVVTSDKALAWRVRISSAHTESIENFISWLNRSYKNKIRQIKKEKQKPPASGAAPLSSLSPPPFIPSKDAPLEAHDEYYARVFELEWQKILKKEEKIAQEKPIIPSLKKRPPRKPKKRLDPFEIAQTPEEKTATEMERWLKIFEKKLEDPDKK